MEIFLKKKQNYGYIYEERIKRKKKWELVTCMTTCSCIIYIQGVNPLNQRMLKTINMLLRYKLFKYSILY